MNMLTVSDPFQFKFGSNFLTDANCSLETANSNIFASNTLKENDGSRR